MSLADWIATYTLLVGAVLLLGGSVLMCAPDMRTYPDQAEARRLAARLVLGAPLWPLALAWAVVKAIVWLFRTAFPKESK